jgi:CBS domain-containing protein
MPQNIRDVMTSNPCTIDADKSVAYAAKMMRDEDVGLAPIVEGDKLIGKLTDRDIAVRVAAQGRNPDQVKVRDVASKQVVTIDPQQDLDQALRIMAKHQVRRLPVVEKDGRLIGVVAQADIAREGDDSTTGQVVHEITESGGQMSSFEEGQFPTQVESPQEGPEIQIGQQEEQIEEEGISKVQASRPRRRSTSRKRTTASRKKSTGTRKKRSTGTRKKKSTTARKKSSTSRKRSTGTRKRSTARRSTAGRKRKTTTRKKASTSRKRSTGTRKRKTTARKRTTGARKKTGTARKRSTGTRKRKTTARKRTTGARKKTGTARKRSTGTRKRKTTARKSTGTRKKRSTARRGTGRTTVRAAGRKGGRKTARKRTTRRKAR